MPEQLRVLHLEDDPDYAALVRAMLEEAGLCPDVVWVSDGEAFRQALETQEFDVILSDYHLPTFSGLEALKIAQEKAPATPSLLISGTVGEQAAIESLRCGATDYVLKSWPDRLVPAVKRAVSEAAERRRCQAAEREVAQREAYFRALTENSLDVLSILDREGRFQYHSASVKRVLGYEPAELQGQCAFDRIHPDDLPRVQQAFAFGVEHPDHPATVEYRYRHKDGSWRHLEAIGQNYLADPNIGGLVVNSRDVTERYRAQTALRESERRYRLFFHSSPNPMFVFDRETLAFLEVNDAACRLYGYAREDFLRLTCNDLHQPQEIPAFLEAVRKQPCRLGESDLGLGGQWRHRRQDGTRLDAELKWANIWFEDQPAILTLVNDVTERLRAERQAAAFARLGHRLSSASTPQDAARIISEVTDELFGWDFFLLQLWDEPAQQVIPILVLDELKGQRTVLSAGDLNLTPSPLVRRIIRGGAELILREPPFAPSSDTALVGDKSRPSASLMFVPVRSHSQVTAILSIQSYTPRAYTREQLALLQSLADHCGGALERIRAAAALRETQQRLAGLFENSPDPIFVEDLNGRVLDANPAAGRLHGVEARQLIGRNVLDLVPPELREETRQRYQRLTTGEECQVEGVSYTEDGRRVPVEVRVSRMEYAGRPALLLHVRDLTERKDTESALHSSERLFFSVWENSVDGMRLTDENGIIVAVNEAFCKLVGLPRTEIEGQPLTIAYSDKEDHEHQLQRYRARFHDRVVERQTQRQLTLHNGTVVDLEITNSFVESPGRPPLLLGLFRDLTAHKRLEDQLRQSQKMDAIGQLAGGVAHDFNNILTIIQGHSSLLLSGSGLDGQARRSAQAIGQAAERAAGLTRQLLTFSRRQVMQSSRLDLNEIVGNLSKMLERILGEDIALRLRYAPQPLYVLADASMIEQTVLNLVVNARDAMPRGGELNLSLALVNVEAKHAELQPAAHAGRFVCLTVQDCGCGIPPENLRLIFEPFFTTKGVGKGTGLGLATVYGVARQHGGWVEAESVVGNGATFRVYLPLHGEMGATNESTATGPASQGGHETILVVEDEHYVRELVCSLLEGQGYQVLQAASGPGAVEVWSSRSKDIDLLLTDIVMPDRMNGRELAERLWQDQPQLKVIFTSGYSTDVAGGEFVRSHGSHYLQKPYHPQKLTTLVREVLDQHPVTN